MAKKKEREVVDSIVSVLKPLKKDDRDRVLMAAALLLDLTSVLPLESKEFRLVARNPNTPEARRG